MNILIIMEVLILHSCLCIGLLFILPHECVSLSIQHLILVELSFMNFVFYISFYFLISYIHSIYLYNISKYVLENSGLISLGMRV